MEVRPEQTFSSVEKKGSEIEILQKAGKFFSDKAKFKIYAYEGSFVDRPNKMKAWGEMIAALSQFESILSDLPDTETESPLAREIKYDFDQLKRRINEDPEDKGQHDGWMLYVRPKFHEFMGAMKILSLLELKVEKKSIDPQPNTPDKPKYEIT